MSNPDGISLVARRVIRATPERLFEAWTQPRHLERWWGPRDASCFGATVDLRVGGAYRIGNRFPDGRTVWIAGEFELIDPPRRLVYTWRLESPDPRQTPERVTVEFKPVGDQTEVIVTHERIDDETSRRGHQAGWVACLDGLAAFAGGAE